MFGRRHNNGGGVVVVWLLFSLLHASPSSSFGASQHIIDSKSPLGNVAAEPEAAHEMLGNMRGPAPGLSMNGPGRVKREACENSETPFVCVAKSILDQQNLRHKLENIKCPDCTIPECKKHDQTRWKFGSVNEGVQPLTMCNPTSILCTEDNGENCLRPVKLGSGSDEYWMLFPVNVCTREMVRNGECPMEKLSSDPYDFIKLEYSTAYFMQCDDSWILPSTAGESGCIPSLHVAGGLAPDDPEVFPGEVKDLDYNRIKDKFCRVGVPATGDCILPPLSGFKLPKRLEDAGFKEAMVTPCSYKQRGEKIEKDCVLLDLMMDGKVVIADRNGHGPYATLQSRNDSLTMTWKVDNQYPYSFPRCIDLSNQVGLPENHFDTAVSDSFLNCAKNPYYARAKVWQITIDSVEPFNCNTDKELRRLLCRSTNPNLTSAASTPKPPARSPILGYISWFEWWTCGCFFLVGFLGPLLGFVYIAVRLRSIPMPALDAKAKWKLPSKKALAAIDKFVKEAATKCVDLDFPLLPPDNECKEFIAHKDQNRNQLARIKDKFLYKIDGCPDLYIAATKGFRLKGCDVEWMTTQAPLSHTCETFWLMIESLIKKHGGAPVPIISLDAFDPVLEGDAWYPDVHKKAAVVVEGDTNCRFLLFGKMKPTAVEMERVATVRNIHIANLRAEGYPAKGLGDLTNVYLICKHHMAKDAEYRAGEVNGVDPLNGVYLQNLLLCRAYLETMRYADSDGVDFYLLQSSTGAGPAAIYIAVYVTIERLRKGIETTVGEVINELAEYLPTAISNKEEQFTVYACVLLFFQAHLKARHGKEIQRFLDRLMGGPRF